MSARIVLHNGRVQIMGRISLGPTLLFSLIALAASAFTQAQTQPDAKPAQYFLPYFSESSRNAPQLSKEAGEKLPDEHMAEHTQAGRRTQTCDCRAIYGRHGTAWHLCIAGGLSGAGTRVRPDSDPVVQSEIGYPPMCMGLARRCERHSRSGSRASRIRSSTRLFF